MPNWEMEGDDACDCTYSKACPYHAERQAASRADWVVECEAKGMNPDADVTGYEDEVIRVMTDPNLSERQRDSALALLFPRKP